MPMMYKMGVMMTMLTVLTLISLKGLLIGKRKLLYSHCTYVRRDNGSAMIVYATRILNQETSTTHLSKSIKHLEFNSNVFPTYNSHIVILSL